MALGRDRPLRVWFFVCPVGTTATQGEPDSMPTAVTTPRNPVGVRGCLGIGCWGILTGGPSSLFGGSRKAAGTDRLTAEFPMPGTGLFVSDQVVQKSDTEREPDARDVPDERPVEPEGRRERVAGRAPDASQGAPAKGAREGEGLTTGQLCEVSARDGRP